MLRVNLKKNNELIKLILTFNSVNAQPFLRDKVPTLRGKTFSILQRLKRITIIL